MKKKILALALVVVLAVTAVTGATLAYFTDEAEATNTFTTAKIDIALKEQQRGANGLEPFAQNKKLFPIVGSAQGEKDAMGMPVAKNYVDKIITIENLATSTDAYVRLYIAIPSALDNVKDAGQNVLHFNFGNDFATGEYTTADYANWGAETLLTTNFAIDGTNYNIYYRDYNKVMTKNTETGSAAYVGFYLDSQVDYDNDNNYYTINGEEIKFNFSNGVTIPVYAVGVQAAGFDACAAAVDAAFGANFNPFAA